MLRKVRAPGKCLGSGAHRDTEGDVIRGGGGELVEEDFQILEEEGGDGRGGDGGGQVDRKVEDGGKGGLG